jgi:hypothetical protein
LPAVLLLVSSSKYGVATSGWYQVLGVVQAFPQWTTPVRFVADVADPDLRAWRFSQKYSLWHSSPHSMCSIALGTPEIDERERTIFKYVWATTDFVNSVDRFGRMRHEGQPESRPIIGFV